MEQSRKQNENCKRCFVPLCTNTSAKTPDKLFISVPKGKKRRRWVKAIRRDTKKFPLSEKSTLRCCEDHFNLEEDMENYTRFKLMGVGRVQLKDNVVPHIFSCQPGRTKVKRARPAFLKRQRLKTIQEALISASDKEKCNEGDVEFEDISIINAVTLADFVSGDEDDLSKSIQANVETIHSGTPACRLPIFCASDAATSPLKIEAHSPKKSISNQESSSFSSSLEKLISADDSSFELSEEEMVRDRWTSMRGNFAPCYRNSLQRMGSESDSSTPNFIHYNDLLLLEPMEAAQRKTNGQNLIVPPAEDNMECKTELGEAPLCRIAEIRGNASLSSPNVGLGHCKYKTMWRYESYSGKYEREGNCSDHEDKGTPLSEHLLSPVRGTASNEDEWDIFGKLVARMLRKMPDKKVRKVQRKILNILQ